MRPASAVLVLLVMRSQARLDMARMRVGEERMAVLESMSRRPGLFLSRIPKQSNLRRAREGSEG